MNPAKLENPESGVAGGGDWSTGVSRHCARIPVAVSPTKETGVSGQAGVMESRVISFKGSIHALESYMVRCTTYVEIYLRGRIDARFQRAQTAKTTVAPALAFG